MTNDRVRECDGAATPATALGDVAHPDGEEFGTVGALCGCVDRGVSVVASATSGEAGLVDGPALATRDTLDAVRAVELRRTSAPLGVASPILTRYSDGGLSSVPPGRLRDVVVSFDANGGSHHPDHFAICHAAIAAVAAAGEPVFRPELGSPTCPISTDLTRAGLPPMTFGNVQTPAPDESGTTDERGTTVVPVGHPWELHAQYGLSSPFRRGPKRSGRISWPSTACPRPPVPGTGFPVTGRT